MDPAMSTAVSALQAQSQALSTISDNLANSSTTGYKAVRTLFNDILSRPSSSGAFPALSVYTIGQQNVQAQGSVTTTNTATNMAIAGNGLFAVTDGLTSSDYSFTRDGAFTTDNSGNLYLSGTNYYLRGWPTTSTGAVVNPNVDNISSLTPVNVSSLAFTSKPTTEYTLSANLPSDVQSSVYSASYTSSGTPALSEQLTMSYQTISTTSTLSTYKMTVLPSNSSATITDSAGTTSTAGMPLTYYVSVNSSGGITAIKNAVSGASITVPATGNPFLTFTPSDTSTPATPVSAPTTWAGMGTPYSNQTSMSIYDSLGTEQDFPITWTPEGGTSWLMTVGSPTSPDGKTVTGTLVGTDGASVSNYSYNVTFNSDGSFGTIKPIGNAPNPAALSATWFDHASSNSIVATPSNAIALNLGTYGKTTGLTQYYTGAASPSVNINTRTQDGLPLGKLQSIAISSEGYVNGTFSNGQTIPIYKVPIVNFTNEDGLSAHSNNVYKQTQQSGTYTLNSAGVNGAGTISGSSLESSTVDTSQEFSNMIVAQQAYSAASQVISSSKQDFTALMQVVQ
jgi:flagellar hook protein FlgE